MEARVMAARGSTVEGAAASEAGAAAGTSAAVKAGVSISACGQKGASRVDEGEQ